MMELKLGQKVKYSKIVQKTTNYIKEEDFYEEEIVTINKCKIVELKKIRTGFVIGTRKIARIAKYTLEDMNPDLPDVIVWQNTELIKVLKVAYDPAHTNWVLEKDLIEEKVEEETFKRNITRYHEDEEFVSCYFEILGLKPEEIDNELIKIKGTFKEKWFDMLVVIGNNIKCELWITDTRSGMEEVNLAKKDLICILKKQGYNWGKETIRGDGHMQNV